LKDLDNMIRITTAAGYKCYKLELELKLRRLQIPGVRIYMVKTNCINVKATNTWSNFSIGFESTLRHFEYQAQSE
jgi:hypothetical protein